MSTTTPPRITKRTALIVATAILVVMAAGSGVVTLLNGPPQPRDTGPASVTDQTTTPVPPTTTGPGGSGSGGSGAGTTSQPPSGPTVNATLDASVSGFDDIETTDGSVPGVVGRLSGTLDWSNRSVDRVEFVVHTWIPGEGWRVAKRTTVSPADTDVTLAEAFARTGLVYATGENASAFSNPVDGSTLLRDGFVSVTARLYADGERVDRERTIESFSFGVTNLAGTSDGDGDTGQPALVLDAEGTTPTVFGANNVVPTTDTTGRLTIANDGPGDAELRIAVTNRTSAENGFTDPEAEVDGDSESELPANIRVRVSLRDDGTTTYVVGGEDEMVAYDSLDADDFAVERSLAAGEDVTLVVEWHVPRSAGNEIQSDSVSLDLSITLVDQDQELFAVEPVRGPKAIGEMTRNVEAGHSPTSVTDPTNWGGYHDDAT